MNEQQLIDKLNRAMKSRKINVQREETKKNTEQIANNCNKWSDVLCNCNNEPLEFESKINNKETTDWERTSTDEKIITNNIQKVLQFYDDEMPKPKEIVEFSYTQDYLTLGVIPENASRLYDLLHVISTAQKQYIYSPVFLHLSDGDMLFNFELSKKFTIEKFDISVSNHYFDNGYIRLKIKF